MKNLKRYTSAQKLSSVLELLKGEKSKVEIAQKIGCHPSIIGDWKEQLEKEGEVIFERKNEENSKNKKIAKLERTIGKLTTQTDFLEQVLGSYD
jgi:transposase